MTQDRLAAVLAALDAATEAEARMTPGEWFPSDDEIHGRVGRREPLIAATYTATDYIVADALGIALARNQWPALLRLARAYAGWRLDQTIETWDALESAFADLGGL